ncbi:PRC-barrel domain-containing protein [Candidatus Woesearchaeota archaeon]|nr:PRC-barrel domain-containing protein [Candidatus Woesearchaeota archaeon]
MPEEDKRSAKQLMGKVVVTKSGKRFGEVSNLSFETRTGELMYIILKNPTTYAQSMELEKDTKNNLTIPYSAVVAIGDFIVVAEEELI